MLKTKLMLIILFLSSNNILAQNLITNPGFENGMSGWNELWTRTPGAGMSEIVANPVHSGNSALHIVHWGAEDWSFRPAEDFYVKPGYIYKFSAWVNMESLVGWSGLCITTLDSNHEAIDWSYVIKNFIPTNGTFEKFTTQFIVPKDVKFVWPRFIGADSCDLYIDDVEFILTDSIQFDLNYTLENENLKVNIHTIDFTFDITNKINQKTYSTQSSSIFQMQSVDSSNNSYAFHCRYIPDDFDITIKVTLQDKTLKFQLIADSSYTLSDIIAFPGSIASNADDYFIVPYAAGVIHSVREPFPLWSFPLWGYKSTMSFVGVTNLQSGYMITSDDPWDTQIDFQKPRNQNYHAIQLLHIPSKGKFGYPRTFYYTFIDNEGYIEMCRWYRSRMEELGYVKTFQEKMIDNPNVGKLLGAVDFWALDAHFKNVTFIDSLIDFGMDRAIISLGGSWYNPQQLSELIDSINTRGLLSSRYDIYTDVWPPTHPELPWYRTEGYPEDVIVDADGSLHEGWLAYLEDGTPFQGYYTCSETHTRYAQKWIPQDLETNHYNCRFIDVELASHLWECYSPVHPVTRHEDAIYRTQLMDVVKNGFGLVTGGEEARDFAFPAVDYGEGTMSIVHAENAGYDWYTPTDDPGEYYVLYNMNPTARIPLHGLVYHDVHIPTWYTGDGISKVPPYWDNKDLFNILYASMPLFMPPGKKYWNTYREKFITSYHLTSSVFRSAGFDQMTDHKMLSTDWKVQQTSFSNGWKVIANFGSTEYEYEGITIPSMGFYATNGEYEVYKLVNEGNPIAVARLSDRLLINPFDHEITLMGVRTHGSVFLKKYEDFISLAFIESQEYVDIHPALLPWRLSSVTIYTKDKSNELQLDSLSNGWLRINKFENEIFYRIEGNFNGTSIETDTEDHSFKKLELNIYPNPFNNDTNIHYYIINDGQVKLKLFNVLGELIEIPVNKYQKAGSYKVTFSSRNLASGIYFCQLKSGDKVIVKKIVITK